MIPKPYRDNFDTLRGAFSDGAACLLECRERTTGRSAYVICALNHRGTVYDLVPFARLFDDDPYALLAPPGEMDGQPASVEGGRP